MNERLPIRWGGHSCLPFGEAESDRACGFQQAAVPILLAVLMLIVGCRSGDLDPNDNGYQSPITSAPISYPELVAQYNPTVEDFDTLWARTDVVIEWREVAEAAEGGDAAQPGAVRREQGEGKFMYRRPGDTALLVEKLGQIYLWAGSNRERYWLLDISDSDAKRAYVGDFAKLGQPGGRRYPLPVRPDAVPYLLGLLPLPYDAEVEAEWPEVQLFDGQYLVEPPGMGTRMLIDPETFRPTRVDLLDAEGYSVLTAKLQGSFPVDLPGIRKTRWPSICERAEVYVSGYESKLTVAMDFVTNDPRKVSDMQFDFDALVDALGVEQVVPLDQEVVPLDKE